MGLVIDSPHPWDVSIEQARTIQTKLASSVVQRDVLPSRIAHIAGIDIGFEKDNTITRAAVVVVSYPQLDVIEQVMAKTPTRFPYVPGYLSFREVPAAIMALEKLSLTPDLLMCDGQGLAHPRRFGVACHLGVLANLPAIGVAKKKLVGEYTDPGPNKGDWTELVDKGEVIGSVLRSRQNVKPVFISIGHKISLSTAREIVIHCLTAYKLPEPTRLADRLASAR